MSSLFSLNVNVTNVTSYFVCQIRGNKKSKVISSVMKNIHTANIHHCTAVLPLF